MAGNTASLTFKLFGIDVTASRTISGVGVAAAGTTKQLETLATGTTKFVAAAGAASIGAVGLAGTLGVGLGAAFAGVGVKAALMNKDVQKHFKDLGTGIKNEIAATAAPVQKSMLQLVGYINSTFKTMRPVLQGIFSDIAPLVTVFGQGLVKAVANVAVEFRPFISEVLPIVRTAFAQLPDLIGNLAAALHMILDPLAGNTKAFELLIQTVSSLLPIVGSILGNLVQAGQTIMPAFRQALLAVGTALDSGLGKVLPLVGKALNQILPPLSQLIGVLLGALGQVLAAAIPVLSRFVAMLATGLAKVLPSVVPAFLTLIDAVNSLLPAVVPLIPPIAVLLKGVSSLVPPLAQLAAALVVALSPALDLVVKGVTFLASWLGAKLTQAVALVQPYLVKAAAFLGKNLGPAVQAVGSWISKTLVPALETIGRFILTKVLPPIATAVKALVAALWPALKTVWNAIVTQLVPALAKLWPLVKFVGQVVGVVLFLALTKVLPVVLRLAGPVLGFLISVLGKVIGWIGNLIGALGRAITWIGRVDGAIISAFGRAASWLFDAGRRVITGFWNGIKAMWNTVVGWFKGLPGKILSALGIHSPPAWAIDAGRHIMGGLLKGIAHGAADVRGFFRGLASSVTGPLARVWAGITAPGGPAGYGSIVELAKAMVAARWGMGQWDPFFRLEMAEAGFNPFATNPSSGAFGIPQALPPSKLPPAARSIAVAGGLMNMAAAQLQWMLGYIADRYGNPAGAWAHEQAFNWYGTGLPPTLFTRPTLIGVGEGGPEVVSVTPGRSGGATVLLNVQAGQIIGSDLRKASADLLQGIREDLRRRGKVATANLL